MPDSAEGLDQRQLSVAIAAWTGIDELRACLTSLRSQVAPDTDEVIVARNFALAGGESLAREFPWVTDLSHGPDVTVPRLRAAALRVANGAIIAFLEDHCECAAGWRAAIVNGHRLPFEAVGGPVDLAAGGHPLDWAAYFYDYARFAPPMASGPTPSLSGANASYKRRFLELARKAWQVEITEIALQNELTRQDARVYLSSEAIVVHRKRNSAASAVGLAFALARGYASHRLTGARPARRAAFALATFILPLLLALRISSAIMRTRRHLVRLAAAFPWLLVLLLAWSTGEFTGYLAGAGDSQRRWR